MASKRHNPATDVIAAASLILVAAVFFAATLDLRDSPYEPLGPASLPRALCILIFVCSVILMGRGILGVFRQGGFRISKPGPETVPSGDIADFKLRPQLAVTMMVFLIIYIGLLHWRMLGYRSGCFLFMMASGLVTLWYEKRAYKPFHLAVLLVLTLLMSFGGYYVFTKILIVDLP